MNKLAELLGNYTNQIDEALRKSIPSQDGISLYQHLEYFLGFRDEELRAIEGHGGKRFRPTLCLMLGDWYGNKDAALSVAVSIELFHNFTLIHDDIVDGDALRRGRQTVWKLFGTDHAINDGDAQLVLALQHLVTAKALDDEQKTKIQSFLLTQYLRVAEGQHMDFALTAAKLGDAVVTKENYIKMITRKTADLVAASVKGAGLAANVSEAEQQILFEFGETLGVAYQMYDDMVSVWGTQNETGKHAYGDLYEKKKSLPVLYAYEKLPLEEQTELTEIYNRDGELSEPEVGRLVELLEQSETHIYMNKEIDAYRKKATELISQLSLTAEQQESLNRIVAHLLPSDTLAT